MHEWRFPAWDPVLLEIKDPIHLRWYGVMFLCAFVGGQFVLQRLARRRLLPMEPERVGDFLFWLVIGVLLGGRLGYSLFYSPHLWSNPLDVLKVWEGGLSFHGGLLGVCIAFLWYARKHRIDPWRLGDGCALGTPFGIACVRLANFINGELYGRVIPDAASAPPWAMRFPTEDKALQLLGIAGWSKRDQELGIQKAVHGAWDGMPAKLQTVPDWDSVKDQVPLRHPSQIYEMLGEGVLLGLLLWLVLRLTRRRPLGSGVYGGLFLLGYGCVRFVIEFFRQPDRQFEKEPGTIGTVWLGLSMGQLLCTAMILAGLLIVLLRWGKGRDLTGSATAVEVEVAHG